MSAGVKERRARHGDEMRAWARDHYAKNGDKIRAYNKAYIQRDHVRGKGSARSIAWYRANKERARERAKALLARHPERAAIYDRRHYDRHVEQSRATADRYRRANMLRYREAAARRRARERATATERIDYQAIWDRDCGVCHICQLPVDRAVLHYDHVIPLAKGGTHTYDNIKVSHADCNIRKSAKIIT
jgi:5-methylcytosine-specific restriction endonuclease McrA